MESQSSVQKKARESTTVLATKPLKLSRVASAVKREEQEWIDLRQDEQRAQHASPLMQAIEEGASSISTGNRAPCQRVTMHQNCITRSQIEQRLPRANADYLPSKARACQEAYSVVSLWINRFWNQPFQPLTVHPSRRSLTYPPTLTEPNTLHVNQIKAMSSCGYSRAFEGLAAAKF